MRTFARFESEMLLNPDWTGLTPQAQSAYITLLIHPSLSMCGVADWRPKRLSQYSSMTAKEVEDAGRELEKAGFIVLDEDTDEVLIRSFLRHDMPLKSPKTAVSVNKAYCLIASAALRMAVVREAHRLYEEHPEWSGWDKVPVIMEQIDTLSDTVSDTLSDTVSDSTGKGIHEAVHTLSDTVCDTPSDRVSDTVSDTLFQENRYPITKNGIIQNPESRIHNPESGSRGAATRANEHPASKVETHPSRRQPVGPDSKQTPKQTLKQKPKQNGSKTEAKPDPVPVPAPGKENSLSGAKENVAYQQPIEEIVEAEVVDDKQPSTKRKKRKPKTADEWYPTPQQIIKANSLGLNIQNEITKFRNVAAYRPQPYRNFDRAFDNWLIRAEEEMQRGRNRVSKTQLNQDANMRLVMEIAAQSAANGTDQPTYNEEDFR